MIGSPGWLLKAGIHGEPPTWVRLLRDTLTNGQPTVESGRERSGLEGLLPVVRPLARTAGERLTHALTRDSTHVDVDIAGVRSGFESDLARRLVRLAARTLVLELNIARVTGTLGGASPMERFDDFVARAASQPGLTRLLTEYPVLARLLGQACEHGVDALVEACERFTADRTEIVTELLGGADPGVLSTMEVGAGDSHQRGRTVALLRFTNGATVVYKPRPVAVHRHFNEVVAWFNSAGRGPPLRTVALVDRRRYGWAEFVTARPCTTQDQVERFYYRQGSLLALLYVLSGIDFHLENLIACGEDPVLIDLETLFHPTLERSGDPAARAWNDSVHWTGLLPARLLGDTAALDLSGLGGDRGAPSPVDIVEWEAAGTDEMRLVRRPGRGRGAENRPSLAGVVLEPASYVDQLVSGFRESYDTIAAGRAALTGSAGPLGHFAHDEVRVVVRPTRLYATLLDESTHPDVMGDASEREAILDNLRDGLPYVDDELADLWAGDIPYFSTRPDSTDLWTSTGRRIPDVLTEPVMSRVTTSIDSMSPSERQAQEWIIRAALASRADGDPHATATMPGARQLQSRPQWVDKDRLLAAARGIADTLAATACHGDGRANWLGLELQGDRFWQLAPMGAALGNGYCGPALFLAQLFGITGEARHADLARRATAGLPRLLGQLKGHPDLDAVGSGGFAGLGGIAYALAHIAQALDDSEVAEWVEPAVDLVAAAAPVEAEVGVVGGIAGGLGALIAVHTLTGRPEAWAVARQCADRLLTHPLPVEPGFAAGSAGVGWALLRYAAAGGGDSYRQAGLAALRTAADQLPNQIALGQVSWCRGLTGVALACLDVPTGAGDPELGAVATRGLRAALDHGPLADHSLCHGELGRLTLVGADREACVGALPESDFRCATPHGVPSAGLLTGLAGIGHGLLRLAFPDRVPSVLLLHASPGGGREA